MARPGVTAVAEPDADTPARGQEPPKARRAGEARRTLGPAVALAAALVSVAALLVSLLAAGGAPAAPPPGLPDAGSVMGWSVRISRLVLDASAVLTVGFLLTGAVLIRNESSLSLDDTARRVVHAGGHWAGVWAVAAGGSFVLTASDTTGRAPGELSAPLLRTMASAPPGRALLLVALIAAVVGLSARRTGSVTRARCLLVLAIAALLPVPLAGHAAAATDQHVASSALVVHVVAAALWVGGLAGLVFHLRRAPGHLVAAAPRYSALALGAFVALAGSGILVAAMHLGTSPGPWASGYGAVVAAKASALVALGVVGAAHRRRTLPRLSVRDPGMFLRLAGVELVLMAAAAGMAVALTRTPTPPAPPIAEPSHGTGHDALPAVLEPFSWPQLLTAWRVDALVVLAVALTYLAYRAGVRTLARSGRPWPRRRSTAFAAGLFLAVLTLCSGTATYAPAMISVQIAQLLAALLVVPLFLTCGAPLALWLQVRDVRTGANVAGEPVATGWVRLASDAATGAALVCVLLLALYRSPLIELSLRSPWVHLLTLVAAVVAGTLMMGPLLGLDPAARARSGIEPATAVVASAGCLGLLAVQLGRGDRLLAGEWFLELRWGWVDPVADQRLGAAFMGVAAVTVVLVGLAVLVARSRRSAP